MDSIKILLLGYRGKIGSRLSSYLLDRGFNLVFFDGNINNLEAFRSFISHNLDITHVLNLIGSFRGDTTDLFKNNVESVNSLCTALENQLPKVKIVHFSTGGVYHPTDMLKHENAIPDPATYYTFCKLLGEQIVSFHKKNTNLTILRLGSVYGDGVSDGFIYNMHKSAQETGKVRIIGSVNKIRSILDIEYLLEIVEELIKRNNKHEVINVCTESITLEVYLGMLKNKFPNLTVEFVPDLSDNDKLSHMHLDSTTVHNFYPMQDKFRLKI